MIVPVATAPGHKVVAQLSPTFRVQTAAKQPLTQERHQPDSCDLTNAKRYVVLEGESGRTLAQSAAREEALSHHREAILEGGRTERFSDDRVITELNTYQWKGTERSLPVEMQLPGCDARPSTFFIVNSACTRSELAGKIASWVVMQVDVVRQSAPHGAPVLNTKKYNEHRMHLIGLYGIEDPENGHEIFKYVTDLSVDVV